MQHARAHVFAGALIIAVTTAVASTQQAPRFDSAAVDRGRQLLVAECSFCHGANARGGASGGSDLTRSALVQTDEDGKQLAAFLRVGRIDRGMPKFDLTDAQVSDLATFLHSEIRLAIDRSNYKILDVLTGDPKAGEAFFNGAGRCSTCHAPAGDLKGIGAKYDPVTLQGRSVLPRGRPPGSPPQPAYLSSTAIQATVTLESESVKGALIRLTDFDVTVFDPSAGRMRSWTRNGDTPKVLVTDPLQAHMDFLPKWTDADMHNVTAYLASLK